jgi:hypothetical protein
MLTGVYRAYRDCKKDWVRTASPNLPAVGQITTDSTIDREEEGEQEGRSLFVTSIASPALAGYGLIFDETLEKSSLSVLRKSPTVSAPGVSYTQEYREGFRLYYASVLYVQHSSIPFSTVCEWIVEEERH